MGEEVGRGLVWVGFVEVAQKGGKCFCVFASSWSVEKIFGN